MDADSSSAANGDSEVIDLAEIKSRINPAYKDVQGTESHERKQLCDEIERLREKLNYANAVIEQRNGEITSLRAALQHEADVAESYKAEADEVRAKLELAEAFKAACEKQDAVLTEEMFDCVLQESELSFKRHCRSIRGQMITVLDMPDYHVASAALRLFGLADPEAAKLRQQVAKLTEQREHLRHTVPLPDALKAMQEQVAEACAKVCDDLADCEQNTDAYRAGAHWCREIIRSGEWRKCMDGKP